jgi:hypothetical protein
LRPWWQPQLRGRARRSRPESSLFEYLCERNAVTHNPVKGVQRPPIESYQGKTPALGDHQPGSSSMWPRKLVDGAATRLAGVHRDDARNARTVVMERLAIPAPTVTLFNRLIVRRYATRSEGGARGLHPGLHPRTQPLQDALKVHISRRLQREASRSRHGCEFGSECEVARVSSVREDACEILARQIDAAISTSVDASCVGVIS